MYIKKLSNKRIWSVFIFFFLIISLLCYRVFKLQYLDSKKYSEMTEAQYSYRENRETLNYKLLDRKGIDLSDYKKKYVVVVVPSAFKGKYNEDSEGILNLTYTLKNFDLSYDLSKVGELKNNPKFYWEVDEVTYNKVKNIKSVQGVYAYEFNELIQKGSWNIESLLINPRRAIDNSFKDENSIEMMIYNKTKNNKYPQVVFEKDISGNIIKEGSYNPENNTNIKLTIDKDIQDKISELLRSDKYKNYSQSGAIIMEADTGKILAMAQKDDSKPNVNIGAATENGFYPGSIFKVIVEAAALTSGALDLKDQFTCRGFYEHAHEKHGTLNSHGAMVVSCNDIYSQIAGKSGYKEFYALAEKQGLFSKVLGFDNELAGKLEISEPKQSDGTLSIAAMGQGMRITPIEAISISNTVANNGIYVKPYIIDSFQGKENLINKTSSSSIFNKQIAEELKAQMIDVVKNGTAKGAGIYGIETGGKTGSTERGDKSDGWFAGFFTYSNKTYSIIVFVQDIDKKLESGGTTAAPIFKDIVNETVKILNK